MSEAPGEEQIGTATLFGKPTRFTDEKLVAGDSGDLKPIGVDDHL